MIISRDYHWIELNIQVITSSPITSSIILIGVTAPILQATISISISQFISNPINLFIDFQEVSNAFHNRCKDHSIPMATSVSPSHPIYLNSCSKQSISSMQTQLYHGSSPITSSIPNQMPIPSNPPQQLFQTIHIIKATPALSWTKSNHIQHNPYRCHSTIIASHYFHFNLSIHFQPYHSLTFKKSQMLSPDMCKCHSIPMSTSLGPSYPIYLNNSSKQPSSIMNQVQSPAA